MPFIINKGEYALYFFFSSYDTLLGRVWGQEYAGNEDYVNKYVYRLRQKLGDNPECPRIISNARGIGYKFVALR